MPSHLLHIYADIKHAHSDTSSPWNGHL